VCMCVCVGVCVRVCVCKCVCKRERQREKCRGSEGTGSVCVWERCVCARKREWKREIWRRQEPPPCAISRYSFNADTYMYTIHTYILIDMVFCRGASVCVHLPYRWRVGVYMGICVHHRYINYKCILRWYLAAAPVYEYSYPPGGG